MGIIVREGFWEERCDRSNPNSPMMWSLGLQRHVLSYLMSSLQQSSPIGHNVTSDLPWKAESILPMAKIGKAWAYNVDQHATRICNRI